MSISRSGFLLLFLSVLIFQIRRRSFLFLIETKALQQLFLLSFLLLSLLTVVSILLIACNDYIESNADLSFGNIYRQKHSKNSR
jgi:hypothetical protein